MPIFEYRCLSCSHQFESLVMTPNERIVCPNCGSSTVEKLFSRFGLAGDKTSSCTSCSASSCQGCK